MTLIQLLQLPELLLWLAGTPDAPPMAERMVGLLCTWGRSAMVWPMSRSEEDSIPAKPLHSLGGGTWSHLQREGMGISILAEIITNSQCLSQLKTGVPIPVPLSVLREDTASLSFRLHLSNMRWGP